MARIKYEDPGTGEPHEIKGEIKARSEYGFTVDDGSDYHEIALMNLIEIDDS